MISLIISFFLIFNLSLESSPGRVGVRINAWTDKILYVYPGSPADTAGLKAGDKIVEVKDEYGKSDIPGPSGTLVTIKVKRHKEILIFTIERIPSQSEIFNKKHEKREEDKKTYPSIEWLIRRRTC